MSRPVTLLLLSAALFFGCSHVPSTPTADARFDALTREFLSSRFAERPLEAVALGWHQYDGKFVVPDRASLTAETKSLQRFNEAFAALARAELSPGRRYDLALLRSTIAGQRWDFEIQRAPYHNPMTYAGAD